MPTNIIPPALENVPIGSEFSAEDQKRNKEILSHALSAGVCGCDYAIMLTDHQKGGEPVAYVNQAFENLTGYKLAELIGLHPHFLKDNSNQAGVKEIEKAFRQGRACSALLQEKRKDKNLVWYQVNISPIFNEEKVLTHFFGFLRDVTEQVEISKREDESETFIAAVAHDLKTPLIAADRMFALLAKGTFGNPGPELLHTFELMSKGNRSTLELVKNLLESYRMRRSSHLMHFEKINLIDWLKFIISEVEMATDGKRKIELSFSPDFPLCKLDRAAIGRLVTNLLENALKFSPENSKVEVHATSSANELTLSVKDYGIGIPTSDLEFIFQKCGRRKHQEYKPGCGLGLYICKGVATAHKGTISVLSEVDKGTTFTVTLPIA